MRELLLRAKMQGLLCTLVILSCATACTAFPTSVPNHGVGARSGQSSPWHANIDSPRRAFPGGGCCTSKPCLVHAGSANGVLNRVRGGPRLRLAGGELGADSNEPAPGSFAKITGFLTNLFPVWVLVGGMIGLLKPSALAWMHGSYITGALALSMLFMGMTLELDDFRRVLKKPSQVFLGFFCQFTIMPLLGYSMAKLFALPVPLAVGLILVSACPGGTASNLVTLIAKADVALSVLMTTVSTMAAPIMTPLLTSILAGSLVPVDAAGLLISTLQVVLLPVGVGLMINTFLPGLSRSVSTVTPLLAVVFVALICGSVIGQTSSQFVAAGLPLLGAVVCLHLGGFLLGYTVPRLLGNPEAVARTVSIETGMQNSALGVVLANRNFADPLTALPCAISATCHSVIGSTFAAFWRSQKKREASAEQGEAA